MQHLSHNSKYSKLCELNGRKINASDELNFEVVFILFVLYDEWSEVMVSFKTRRR